MLSTHHSTSLREKPRRLVNSVVRYLLMPRKIISTLLVPIFLLLTSVTQAAEPQIEYSQDIAQKLSHLATVLLPPKPIGGDVGSEIALLVELNKNGTLNTITIANPEVNQELAIAAQRLIRMAGPYSYIPSPIADKFPIIRLSVTVLLNDSHAITIKEVRVVGGYKVVYVKF